MRGKTASRWIVALLTLAIMLIGSPTFANDGEVGDLGDTDSITDLYLNAGRITGRIDYVKDCPSGLSGCEIQVRFGYKCPEIWCLDWSWQSWRKIPLPTNGVSTIQADCNGGDNIDNQWQMEYRVRWWATQTKTVILKGENELYIGVGGGFVNRLIAEGVFNVTNQTGVSGYTNFETTTAQGDFSAPVQVATSAGRTVRTC